MSADQVLSGLSIQRSSTADQVAALLRERILNGQLRPGTPLREVAIASSVGVSRNTMREAIRVLVHEGLLRHSVHRGVTVSQLSEKDIADIYQVRRLLELSALEAGEPEVAAARLGDALKQLEKVAEGSDWSSITESDMRFHRELVSVLGSSRLDHFYRNLLSELRLALVLLDQASGDARRLVAQHRELYDLLVEGKLEECKKLWEAHLADSEKLLLEGPT